MKAWFRSEAVLKAVKLMQTCPSCYWTTAEIAQALQMSRWLIRKTLARAAALGFCWYIRTSAGRVFWTLYLHPDVAAHPAITVVDGPRDRDSGWAKDIAELQKVVAKGRNHAVLPAAADTLTENEVEE